MRLTIFFGVLLVAVALSIAPVAAQEDGNETESERFTDIDGNAYIEDWEYDDGTYLITVNASEPTTVYALPPIDAGDETAHAGQTDRVRLDGKNARQLALEGDDEVVVLTDTFFDTLDHVRISSGSDALVGPPYSPDDLWLVGGATAASMGAMTVVRIVMHLFGVGLKPERVA